MTLYIQRLALEWKSAYAAGPMYRFDFGSISRDDAEEYAIFQIQYNETCVLTTPNPAVIANVANNAIEAVSDVTFQISYRDILLTPDSSASFYRGERGLDSIVHKCRICGFECNLMITESFMLFSNTYFSYQFQLGESIIALNCISSVRIVDGSRGELRIYLFPLRNNMLLCILINALRSGCEFPSETNYPLLRCLKRDSGFYSYEDSYPGNIPAAPGSYESHNLVAELKCKNKQLAEKVNSLTAELQRLKKTNSDSGNVGESVPYSPFYPERLYNPAIPFGEDSNVLGDYSGNPSITSSSSALNLTEMLESSTSDASTVHMRHFDTYISRGNVYAEVPDLLSESQSRLLVDQSGIMQETTLASFDSVYFAQSPNQAPYYIVRKYPNEQQAKLLKDFKKQFAFRTVSGQIYKFRFDYSDRLYLISKSAGKTAAVVFDVLKEIDHDTKRVTFQMVPMHEQFETSLKEYQRISVMIRQFRQIEQEMVDLVYFFPAINRFRKDNQSSTEYTAHYAVSSQPIDTEATYSTKYLAGKHCEAKYERVFEEMYKQFRLTSVDGKKYYVFFNYKQALQFQYRGENNTSGEVRVYKLLKLDEQTNSTTFQVLPFAVKFITAKIQKFARIDLYCKTIQRCEQEMVDFGLYFESERSFRYQIQLQPTNRQPNLLDDLALLDLLGDA